MTPALATERLRLRPLGAADAPFILRLVNEPSWLRFIGDRGVRDLEGAKGYVTRAAALYEKGIGLLAVELKDGGAPLGLCGLIRREGLDDVDLGFAFLPEHWGKGYAREAAAASLAHGRGALGLARVVAITSPDNAPSRRLLESLGFRCERRLRLRPDDEELMLYAV